MHFSILLLILNLTSSNNWTLNCHTLHTPFGMAKAVIYVQGNLYLLSPVSEVVLVSSILHCEPLCYQLNNTFCSTSLFTACAHSNNNKLLLFLLLQQIFCSSTNNKQQVDNN